MTVRPLGSWRQTFLWFVGSRFAIYLIGVIGAATFIDLHTGSALGTLTALNPAAVWNKWDVLWYERIARHGYTYAPADIVGQATAAFFPLYPLGIGLLLKVWPSLSFFAAGAVVSNVVSIAAICQFVSTLGTRERAARWLLVFLTCAGSFYLSIPYTESLLVGLVVAALLLTERRRYLLAAMCAGLAAVTRIQGLALAAVPLIACAQDSRLSRPARARLLTLLAVVWVLPLTIHMAYLAHAQGSPTAFLARQALWDNAQPYPFRAVVALGEHLGRLSAWIHGGYWFLYAGLLIRYRRRLPVGQLVFCAGVLVISTQQSFHSTYRYVLPLLPLMTAIADDEPPIRMAIVAFNLIFAVLMILAFVTNNRLAV
jgi:hypothetical protein